MQGGSGRVVARLRLRPVDYEGDDRDGGLRASGSSMSIMAMSAPVDAGKLRNDAPDAARAPVTIAARREAKTVEDAHPPSRDVGNGFGSRKRRNTFSVMRDTLLS